MADILATFFRFRQFLFEYGLFFLIAWLGLAVATGVLTAVMGRADNFSAGSPFPGGRPLRWLWRLLALLWQPGRENRGAFSGWRVFGLAASVPGLVTTSLIGSEFVWLRIILTALFALAMSRFLGYAVWRGKGNPERQLPGVRTTLPTGSLAITQLEPGGGRENIIRVIWRSFAGQVEGAVIPLIVSFGLASALTVYVPAYTVQLWLGEGAWAGPYLAAVLVTPFQLVGGAEVALASALLVKGAGAGTAMSVMLTAPMVALSLLRSVRPTGKVRTVVLYLVVVWATAGTLGAAVDGVVRLIDIW